MYACTQMLDACRRISHYIPRIAQWNHSGTLTACRIVKHANKSEELKPEAFSNLTSHCCLIHDGDGGKSD